MVNGLQKLFEEWKNPVDIDDWRLSIAPTILRAGNAVNRIPDIAEAELNLRWVSREEKEQTISRIRELTGLEVTVTEVEENHGGVHQSLRC